MSYGTCQLPLRVCVLSWLPWRARLSLGVRVHLMFGVLHTVLNSV